MITLSEINTLTNSKDGSIFSDLYKDVYGSRPGGDYRFESIDAFDADFEYLSAKLDKQIDEEKIRQDANMEKFAQRVMDTMELWKCDQRGAVEIIASEADELFNYKLYGPERLEWAFDLKFGSIKQAIFGEF